MIAVVVSENGHMKFAALGPWITLAVHSTQMERRSENFGTGVGIAIWISVAALIVSIALPLYLDSRQSPHVSVRISSLVAIDSEHNVIDYYVISALNRGRATVLINQVNLSYIAHGAHVEVFLPALNFTLGPELSHTLGPYSDVTFGVSQEEVNSRIGDAVKPRFYGSLYLSTGYRVVSRKGLRPDKATKLPNRNNRLRRLKLLLFAKERSRLR
jgi:hypothetical protein